MSFVFFNSCEKDITINFYELLQKDNVKIDSLKINNKVMVVGIDGFRSDATYFKNPPFIYHFSQETYTKTSHLTEEDTYSGPNWSSILTGVHYNKHNVTDNSFDGSLLICFNIHKLY